MKTVSPARILLVAADQLPELPVADYEVTQVTNRNALEKVTAGFDLVIAGKLTGGETLETILEKLPAVPVIALVENEAGALDAIHKGAVDYLSQEALDEQLLQRRISCALARNTYLRRQQEHDPLCTISDIGKASRILAHDVRNALSNILLSMDRIRQSHEEDEETVFYIDIVNKAGDKINKLINRFYLATGEMQVKMQQEDLARIVKNSISGFVSKNANRPKVTGKFNGEIKALADAEKIDAAINNLLQNAWEAGADKAEISVELQVDGKHALLSVQDNAGGMSEETLRQLFRPFYTTRKGQAGLGMYVVQRIVKAHNGSVEVQSGNGGTCVTCRIPL